MMDQEQVPTEFNLPTEFNFGTDNNSLVVENTKEGRHVYFKIGIDPTTKT